MIKILSTTSFGVDAKPSVPCCKILRYVKYPYSMKVILLRQNLRTFLAMLFLLRYYVSLLICARELWWMNKDYLKFRWGSTIDH
jgi:hypothetical protein